MSEAFREDARRPTDSDRRDPDWKPLDEGGRQDVIAREVIKAHPPLSSCRCCGYYANIAKENDVCEICGWQHYAAQESDPDTETGPNDVPLRAAQANFVQMGASSERLRGKVRAPTSYDYLDPEWKPLDGGSRKKA